MATNIYTHRESNWYGDKPSHLWGWLIATSSESASEVWFETKTKQTKLVQKVLRLVELKFGKGACNRPGYPGEWEAMLLACYVSEPTETWMIDELEKKVPDDIAKFLFELSDDEQIANMVEF